MSDLPSWQHARAVLANRTREHGPSDPSVAEARRDFKVAKLADQIRSVVESAPPLTDEQRRRLAALLGAA